MNIKLYIIIVCLCILAVSVFASENQGDNNKALGQRTTSEKIASIDELKNQVPQGTFESIRIIHNSPKPKAIGFDPISLIKAVNHLRDLGFDEAIRRLRIYHDLTMKARSFNAQYDLDNQRLFLIIRLLFIRKDGNPRMPRIGLGATMPREPDDLYDNWPLFPLAVRGDIPFFMVNGYILRGLPESPLIHIKYCQKNCIVRKKPMAPSLSPIQAVKNIYCTKEWQAIFTSRDKDKLRSQAMRCLPENMVTSGTWAKPLKDDASWAKYCKDLQQFKLTWDPKTQSFKGEKESSSN